jgi:tRNA A-37 threonylcarbamoyl transferase component Bud32
MPSLDAGELLADRFEIMRPLGAGGLAEVYASQDRVTGAEVALKVLHRHLLRDPELVLRFQREMAVTRGLDHPGIVRVFDLYAHQGRPFFAMELLRGETLAERIRREGRLTAHEARRIARECCSALEVAHAAGVVHRDLKPANVFLDHRGTKLLDFGQARAAGLTRLTAKSAMMGTPGYFAPELLAGHPGDARADLYAMGAILFEMLTGRRAFDSPDPFVVMRLQRESAPSPRALEEAVSPEDDALVVRALAPDPEERFIDAGQLLDALGGAAIPLPPALPPPLSGGAWDVRVRPLRHWLLQDTIVAPFGIEINTRTKENARAIAELLLGRRPPWEFFLFPNAVMVHRVNEESARRIAGLCEERGLLVAIEPSRPRSRWREWLARHAVGAGFGAVGLASAAAAILEARIERSIPSPPAVQTFILWYFAFTVLLVGYLAFLLSVRGAAPAVEGLREGDPTLQRLAEGIRRRVALLRDRIGTNGAGAGLLEAAEELERAATTLALQLSATPKPAVAPEAATLPYGTAAVDGGRDSGIARLLHMAVALDAALVTVAAPGQDGISRSLETLRSEVQFVRRELPQVSP